MFAMPFTETCLYRLLLKIHAKVARKLGLWCDCYKCVLPAGSVLHCQRCGVFLCGFLLCGFDRRNFLLKAYEGGRRFMKLTIFDSVIDA